MFTVKHQCLGYMIFICVFTGKMQSAADYFIVSESNGLVLDITLGPSGAHGGLLQTAQHKGTANQLWQIDEDGFLASKYMVATIDRKDEDLGGNVTALPRKNVVTPDDGQQWVIKDGLIRSKLNDMVMDTRGYLRQNMSRYGNEDASSTNVIM